MDEEKHSNMNDLRDLMAGKPVAAARWEPGSTFPHSFCIQGCIVSTGCLWFGGTPDRWLTTENYPASTGRITWAPPLMPFLIENCPDIQWPHPPCHLYLTRVFPFLLPHLHFLAKLAHSGHQPNSFVLMWGWMLKWSCLHTFLEGRL